MATTNKTEKMMQQIGATWFEGRSDKWSEYQWVAPMYKMEWNGDLITFTAKKAMNDWLAEKVEEMTQESKSVVEATEEVKEEVTAVAETEEQQYDFSAMSIETLATLKNSAYETYNMYLNKQIKMSQEQLKAHNSRAMAISAELRSKLEQEEMEAKQTAQEPEQEEPIIEDIASEQAPQEISIIAKNVHLQAYLRWNCDRYEVSCQFEVMYWSNSLEEAQQYYCDFVKRRKQVIEETKMEQERQVVRVERRTSWFYYHPECFNFDSIQRDSTSKHRYSTLSHREVGSRATCAECGGSAHDAPETVQRQEEVQHMEKQATQEWTITYSEWTMLIAYMDNQLLEERSPDAFRKINEIFKALATSKQEMKVDIKISPRVRA